jgi:hypothetical protein
LEKKARKDNINEISLDNSDEDGSTSSGDNVITTGGDIEKSPELSYHGIILNSHYFQYLYFSTITVRGKW